LKADVTIVDTETAGLPGDAEKPDRTATVAPLDELPVQQGSMAGDPSKSAG
jgi:hypothetical protein